MKTDELVVDLIVMHISVVYWLVVGWSVMTAAGLLWSRV